MTTPTSSKPIVSSVEFLVVLERCHGCSELAVLGDGDRVCPRCKDAKPEIPVLESRDAYDEPAECGETHLPPACEQADKTKWKRICPRFKYLFELYYHVLIIANMVRIMSV
jgi:hypothetical protein